MFPADSTNSSTARESTGTGTGTQPSAKHRGIKAKRVIIISSDSEEEEKEVSELALALRTSASDGPQLDCSCTDEEPDKIPRSTLKLTSNKTRLPSFRRLVESSESEEPRLVRGAGKMKKPLVVDVIELTSSSDEETSPLVPKAIGRSKEKGSRVQLPSYLSQEDDGAILVFFQSNEPKSARKPLSAITPRKPPSKSKGVANKVENISPVVTTKQLVLPETPSNKVFSVATPKNQNLSGTKNNKSSGRVSKKALEKAEEIRRQEYAQELFTDLNACAFKNKLPQDTKLNWNKRLLTTAGRAKYRRSRDGTESSEIELATKVLDCDERIRNTLSHEMCHLATWVIDKKLDENHGKLFKYWASKVTKRRPDIEISTRHNYEISYPYKWECQKCQKIYGRYSKSIRPDECVCGACREGQLIPLFTVRTKPQTPKLSRQAAAKPQDSPHSLPRLMDIHMEINKGVDPDGIFDTDTDTADVENLIVALGSTHI